MAGKRTIVHGVGLNDADYPVCIRSNGARLTCPYYARWQGVIGRCYEKVKKKRNESYGGCTVCDEWLTFSNFKAWMITQDWKGKELDKDILKQGNKIYSPENCVFVSPDLNKFTNDYKNGNGEHPLGVSYKKANCKFVARCCNPFTKREEHLGYFQDPNAAHLAWRKRKHEIACIYASMQNDKRVASALLSRYV